MSQVVHDYGDVCQSITELAGEVNEPIDTDDFRTLNRCLDEAIAGAVTEFGREQNQDTLDGETARETERVGYLAHELRNLVTTAIFAFEVLKTGNVGIAGSTGAVLQRSLIGLKDLIGRTLAEVRLTRGQQNRERFLVSGFIDELTQTALLTRGRDIAFTALPVEDDVAIEGDRQVLMAVMRNIVQNAFKFTRPGTTVTLRVGASVERVLIEVEDGCGGLPGGDANELFRPFEQRGANRTGMGLGLSFSRWGAEANSGRIYARNLPGRGCIFTLDLPRVAMPSSQTVSH